jgi:hypothetical protein
MSVAVYNHYKRLMQLRNRRREIEKSNIIMVDKRSKLWPPNHRPVRRLSDQMDATVLTEADKGKT